MSAKIKQNGPGILVYGLLLLLTMYYSFAYNINTFGTV